MPDWRRSPSGAGIFHRPCFSFAEKVYGATAIRIPHLWYARMALADACSAVLLLPGPPEEGASVIAKLVARPVVQYPLTVFGAAPLTRPI